MSSVAHIELCAKCHDTIPITSYIAPFDKVPSRAHCNPTGHELSGHDLDGPTAEMASVAQEIQRMELVLSGLRAHYVRLEKHLEQSRHFMQPSPIRQMPTELLALIFSAACTSFEKDAHKTPLSISLVCSKWRDMAISTPTLWTNIYVGADPALFQFCLDRCGELPFAIKIDKPHREWPLLRDCQVYEDSYEHHVARMADVYKTYRRWTTAEFHMHPDDLALMNAHIPPLDLDILGPPVHFRSVTLNLVGHADAHVELPNALLLAPNLDTVTMLGHTQRLEALGVLSSRIRHLTTDQNNLTELAQISDRFTGTLTLRGTLPHVVRLAPGWTTPSCTLNVTTLVVDPGMWTPGLVAFLHWVVLPELTDLTLVCPAEKDSVVEEMSWRDALAALPDLIAHSGCALKRLTFRMTGTYSSSHPSRVSMKESLLKMLSAAPELERLAVVEAISGPHLLTDAVLGKVGALTKLRDVVLVWAADHPPVAVDIPLSSVVLGVRNGGEFPAPVMQATLW